MDKIPVTILYLAESSKMCYPYFSVLYFWLFFTRSIELRLLFFFKLERYANTNKLISSFSKLQRYSKVLYAHTHTAYKYCTCSMYASNNRPARQRVFKQLPPRYYHHHYPIRSALLEKNITSPYSGNYLLDITIIIIPSAPHC